MRFVTDERLYGLFPALKIGVLICEIDNTRYGEDGLEETIADLRVRFPFGKPQDHPHIKVWREAFSKLGVPASKYYSSIESLLRRALKGGSFPRINPLVDLYNTISLKHLVPMGGHAIGALEGDIFLGFAEGTETFVPMDSLVPETVDRGEVVYKDGREVLTRRWVWRQCDKDKVSTDTHSVFIPIDVMGGLEDSLCEAVMRDMEEGLKRNSYGRVIHMDMVTKDRLHTEF